MRHACGPIPSVQDCVLPARRQALCVSVDFDPLLLTTYGLFLLLDNPLAFLGELLESGEGCHMCGRTVKIMESSRDMFEISFKPFLQAQESIGPEGLHEALCRSFPESVLEGGPIKIPFPQPVIKGRSSSRSSSEKFTRSA